MLILDSFYQFSSAEIIYGDTLNACDNFDCAIKTVNNYGMDKVVFQSIKHLGSKMIYTTIMMDRDGTDKRYQRVSAVSIEDFENITLRIADALINNKTLEEVVNVENILEIEQDFEPVVRKSLSKFGVTVAYIYPQGNSFERVDCHWLNDECSTISYSQMFKFSLVYNYEMQKQKNCS